MDYQYDIAVIGAGPGGYETAIKAAQMGKKTCIIESTYLGGTCLNVGCIPTKTLIKTANVLDTVKHAADFAVEGVDLSALKVDMAKLQKRRQKVVSTLVGGVRGLLRGNKVDILEGTASFADTHTLTVGDKQVSAEYIIVATGSSVFMPPFIAVEGENRLLTSTEALELDEVPDSVAVIGGGVIGVEFAFLLSRLGSKVTVLELMDHILPMVDPEVSALAQKRLEKGGVTFRLGAKVSRVENNRVYYEYNGAQEQLEAGAVLMAVGRTPNTEGLNAQGIGLEFDRNAIKTDLCLCTNVPNIYAIGDITGKIQLAHVATAQGLVAAANCAGRTATLDYDVVPACIYSSPEIAYIGMTAEKAKEAGYDVEIGSYNVAGNGKALVMGVNTGVVKIIAQKTTGKVLGAQIFAPRATDMIAEIAVVMKKGGTIADIADTIHPHPTVSEAVMEAAHDAEGMCCMAMPKKKK